MNADAHVHDYKCIRVCVSSHRLHYMHIYVGVDSCNASTYTYVHVCSLVGSLLPPPLLAAIPHVSMYRHSLSDESATMPGHILRHTYMHLCMFMRGQTPKYAFVHGDLCRKDISSYMRISLFDIFNKVLVNTRLVDSYRGGCRDAAPVELCLVATGLGAPSPST